MARRLQTETLNLDASVALSNRLGERRRERGWSQQRLAQEAGVSIGTIRAIETGRIRDPGIFTVHSIVAALDLPIEALVSE